MKEGVKIKLVIGIAGPSGSVNQPGEIVTKSPAAANFWISEGIAVLYTEEEEEEANTGLVLAKGGLVSGGFRIPAGGSPEIVELPKKRRRKKR